MNSGFFYIIQLVPDLTFKRIKLGFSVNPSNRLRQHQTAAPTAKILATYPCTSKQEHVAIETLAGQLTAKRLSGEVFDFEDIGLLLSAATDFFKLTSKPVFAYDVECRVRHDNESLEHYWKYKCQYAMMTFGFQKLIDLTKDTTVSFQASKWLAQHGFGTTTEENQQRFDIIKSAWLEMDKPWVEFVWRV